jgi:hypothetical protein
MAGADARAFLRMLTSLPGSSLSMPVSDSIMQLQLQLLRGIRAWLRLVSCARGITVLEDRTRYLDLGE